MKETERILSTQGYSLSQAIELLSQVGEGKVRVGKTTIGLETELDEKTRSVLDLFVGH